MPNKSKPMASVGRSLLVRGAVKKVRLEKSYWRELARVAKENDLTVAELVVMVEADSNEDDLSFAVQAIIDRDHTVH
jgi:predicted DNA-binding ribbon-helix-helix protein